MNFEPALPVEDNSWQPPPIRLLAEAIAEAEAPKELQVISSAQVPVIKMVDRLSDLKLDISLDQLTGLSNTNVVATFVQELPLLKPLVLAIKYYLKQESMNETFAGGMGSYIMVLLVVSLLQMHARRKQQLPSPPPLATTTTTTTTPAISTTDESVMATTTTNGSEAAEPQHDATSETLTMPATLEDPNLPLESEEEELGLLFVDFFRVFGVDFDYDNVAISIRDGGAFLDKATRYPLSLPGHIAVEDPATGTVKYN